MNQKLIMGIVLSILFLALSYRNFKVRSECIHRARLTKLRGLLLIIAFLVFLGIAHLYGKHWLDYFVALAGGILLLSSQVGQGLHPKGIYYVLGKGLWLRLVSWNHIQNLDIDYQNNHLIALTDESRSMRIYPDQYYTDLAIKEIEDRVKVAKKRAFD